MALLNWAYIAGFFDGEGHISKAIGAHTIKVSIAQKLQEPLIAIMSFLLQYNIRSGISGGLHASHLNIAQKESVRKFLAGVRPFVIVKKQATEDTWRYLTLWPAMLHGTAARIAS